MYTKRVPTKASVPQGARRLWAQCLIQALVTVVATNDVAAWMDLLALPKATLRGSTRSGAGRKRGEAETKRLCTAWLEGQRSALWRQGRKAPGGRTQAAGELTRKQAASRRERACDLAGQGLFQKACGVLVQAPPVCASAEVAAEMRAKHPPAGTPLNEAELRRVHHSVAPLLDEDSVLKALRSFPKASGGGPSGLKPQHLRDALVPGLRDEVLRNLTAVVALLSQGLAPAELRPFLGGASLTALPKEEGGHRPVACGEVFRRLVAKCLVSTEADTARSLLEPWQVGVGTPGGAEAVVHTCRRWLEANSGATDRVLAKLDLENAFNLVERQALLECTREFCPGLVPWADWTYATSSKLFLGKHELDSHRVSNKETPSAHCCSALCSTGAGLAFANAVSIPTWILPSSS